MDDLISRQDAIKAIDEKAKRIKNEDTLNGLAGAVGILFDLPSIKQQPCEDVISRQAVIDVINGCLINRQTVIDKIKALPSAEPKIVPIAEVKFDDDMLHEIVEEAVKNIEIEPKWIPVSERLPELNKPLFVTAYHRVCYAHMISENGNYGYPVFRLHELKDSDRGWVQETISHEPYSMGRIDAWMYIDIPQPYKGESEVSDADSN